MRISAHFLTSDIGIGSRSQDLDDEDFRILSRFSSDTGVKEDRVFLVEFGLVTEDSVDDYSVDLILRICPRRTYTKCLQGQFYLYSLVEKQQRTCVKSLKQFLKALVFP